MPARQSASTIACRLCAVVLALWFCLLAPYPYLCPQARPDPRAFDDLPDPGLAALLKSIRGGPGRMDLYPQDGRYLYDLVSKNKLTAGVEIDDSRGYSAIWLGMAFRRTGGKLTCIANSPLLRTETLANLNRSGLLDRIDLRLNDAFEIIPKLTGPLDLVYFDGRPRDYQKYLVELLPKVRAGGYIVAHDVARQGGDAAEFIRSITRDPELKTELVTISPAGLSVSRKVVRRYF